MMLSVVLPAAEALAAYAGLPCPETAAAAPEQAALMSCCPEQAEAVAQLADETLLAGLTPFFSNQETRGCDPSAAVPACCTECDCFFSPASDAPNFAEILKRVVVPQKESFPLFPLLQQNTTDEALQASLPKFSAPRLSGDLTQTHAAALPLRVVNCCYLI
ncbi:MAG: hypothetical protein JJU35_04500 [Balneolales bacterium]|nr:hypothetical protein [Balneolales bacterium]